MISNNKIPFGMKGETLVSVSEVESGLACNCICPSCKRRLQANKGKKVSHYFSHDPSEDTTDCNSAFETAIHLMAKQILSEEGNAIFPELTVKVTKSDDSGNIHEEKGRVEDENFKIFSSVELEIKLDDIRPDIIAYQGNMPILIEVAVTHFVDKDKVKIIREKSLPAIEIDLSDVSYITTKEELRDKIISEVKNKKWLSNPASLPVKQKLREILDEKVKRINEGIAKARDKTLSQQKSKFVKKSNTYTPSRSYPAPKITKQYSARWFVCEACRHLFKVPVEKAPYSLESIPCPECDYSVSTKTYMA